MKIILMILATVFAISCSRTECGNSVENLAEARISTDQATQILQGLAANHFHEVAQVYRTRVEGYQEGVASAWDKQASFDKVIARWTFNVVNPIYGKTKFSVSSGGRAARIEVFTTVDGIEHVDVINPKKKQTEQDASPNH